MSVFKHSRLIRAKLVQDKEGEIFITPTPMTIERTEADMMYKWMQGDRLDLIAYEAYGNPQLEHIILMANPQYKTKYDIKVGDTIIIPNSERSDIQWAF